jgi:hypothetical protein
MVSRETAWTRASGTSARRVSARNPVLEASPNAVVAIDVRGRIVYVNPQVEGPSGTSGASSWADRSNSSSRRGSGRIMSRSAKGSCPSGRGRRRGSRACESPPHPRAPTDVRQARREPRARDRRRRPPPGARRGAPVLRLQDRLSSHRRRGPVTRGSGRAPSPRHRVRAGLSVRRPRYRRLNVSRARDLRDRPVRQPRPAANASRVSR